ncbi:GlxA family transcriptional regulator [Phyllobacterium sophorae]|uniref:AraC family transcriptional regulator n=1 Tax=Phyllobacterium sophorae TaxID=1520277 RepID=A0A2P7B2X7_9HYPH|nr:GlxA family transcriptional regulator [Phyllobacterium sophorae]PSH60798.1 AraC family transcriptional regulator [Phyllobacterium sophorae]
MDTSDTNKLFLFYLAPEFTMLAFSSALEALRLANQILSDNAYAWRLVSADGEAVRASCGLSISADLSLAEARRQVADGLVVRMAIVCSGRNVQHYVDKCLDSWLRECRKRRIPLGALCTGSHLLAHAGLLREKRCTIHWENYPSFAEQFTDTLISPHIYEVDDEIYTCAGGTTSFEMMLHIIGQDLGSEVAIEVCQQAIVAGVRDRFERQRLPFSLSDRVKNETLKAIIRMMEENLTEPLPLEAIAKKVRISRRQMERQFSSEFACGPARYYVRLRLERAKSLLKQTGMPVVEVAVACGFVSASHFSRAYRTAEGLSPHETRNPRGPEWAATLPA